MSIRAAFGLVGLFLLGVACGSSGAPDASTSSGASGAQGTGGQKGEGSGGTSATGGSSNAVMGPRWVGRVDALDPSAVRFAWQGAGFVSTVEGSAIAVRLRNDGTGPVFFQPVVDGNVGERFSVQSAESAEILLASGLAEGEHEIELYRETESSVGLTTFLGFSQGTPTWTPASSGRLLEVVGDSISAGYGNLGTEPHPNWVADPACHWTPENSSWYRTYAAVAGHELDAEVSTIARSGWGMMRGLGGGLAEVVPSLYEETFGGAASGSWSFERKASVIVINLGTNDWGLGDPGEAYEAAYIDFITKLRTHNPDAFLFLTIGSMTGGAALVQVNARLANIVSSVKKSTGDDRIATFDLGTQDTGPDGLIPTGCDWHPNVKEHARMAEILKKQLSTYLGW